MGNQSCWGFLKLKSMAKEQVIEQPSDEMQALQKAVVENKADEVMLRNRKIKMKFIRAGVRSKLTDIYLNESDESKVGAKCAAIVVLNGFWAIKLFYWFLWRWFFYIKQYTDEEYIPLMSMCKKKVGVENYFLLTTLLTGMKDTLMTMTRKETEQFLREQK